MKISTPLFLITYLISFIGFLSVFPYISPVFNIFFISVFFLSAYLDYRKKHIIPRWVLNIFSVTISVLLIFQINLSDPATPVLEVLVVLLGIKLLEDKKTRDFMQIYLISMFLLAGSALFNIKLTFLLYFLLLFFLTVTATVLLTYYNEDKNMYLKKNTFLKLLFYILIIPLVSIPFTVVLFFVLPRTEYPLFNFLNREKGVSTGFSDNVSLGEVSSIQENEAVALRVKMEEIDKKFLYWRGTVLNYFDGQTWTRKKVNVKETLKGGIKVKQKIIKEPSPDIYLFGLSVPEKIKGLPVKMYPDYVFVEKKKKFNRVSYSAISSVGGYIYTDYVDYVYLQLPDSIKNDKEIKLLAEKIKGKNVKDTLENILSFFKRNFKYTLKNLPTENPLKDFLFKERAGNCEYFASSAAVLLRINNIPVRLVAGYKGGVYNRIGGYYIISQKDAHVWLEVFDKGKWITFDPTAVSPGIVINSSNNLSLILDTINYLWINMVINFDLQKQITAVNTLKEKIKIPNISISILYVAILVNNLIIFFSILLYIYFRRNEVRFYLWKFYKKMEKYGYVKGKNETLTEFVNRIDNKKIQEVAFEFAKEINEVVYKDEKLSKERRKRIRTFMKNL